MKRALLILGIIFFTSPSFAQNDDGGRDGEKIRARMTEYIQRRLGLTKAEAERFQPLFLTYFNELRKTNRENQDDNLAKQQKVAELRLQYRDQFKTVMGEKRSNDVFRYERDFIEELKKLRLERMENKNHHLSDKSLRGPLQE